MQQPPFGLTVLMDTSVTFKHVYLTLTLTGDERERLTKCSHWTTASNSESASVVLAVDPSWSTPNHLTPTTTDA